MENKTTFTDWLKDRHARSYQGTDDDMPDSFENWLVGLEPGSLLELADLYGNSCYATGYDEVMHPRDRGVVCSKCNKINLEEYQESPDNGEFTFCLPCWEGMREKWEAGSRESSLEQ